MNVLSLDERHVLVQADEAPLHAFLRGWGFEPIPVSFRSVARFGGGLHCFTCDIRRRGSYKSYT